MSTTTSLQKNPAKEAARDLAKKLMRAGHETYFAGGCVRDTLLGQTPKDFDIATAATPKQVAKIIENTFPVGEHFGVMLAHAGEHAFEIATFRTDGSYADGRRPESVEFASAEEDAQRRDFTINGLFEDPLTGEIIDHVGGRKDLDLGKLRAIGNPIARFQEDALRLMRAVRFASRLNLHIETKTMAAIKEWAPQLNRMAIERTREEFSKILTHPNRTRGLLLLEQTGLLDQFLPEFKALRTCQQSPDHHPEGDVHIHTLMMIESLPKNADLELVLATILHDIAKPKTQEKHPGGRISFHGHESLGAEMTKEILGRMKFPTKTIDNVASLVDAHMKPHHAKEMKRSTVRRLLGRPDIENLLNLHLADCVCSNGDLSTHTLLRSAQIEFQSTPPVPERLITGKDLIDRGLKPGPAFRKILEDAQTEQLEGNINSREDALNWLAQINLDPDLN